jgi:hypothetical protein
MDYLHFLTLQITGNCDLKCESCSNIQLQTISCSSSENELECECIERIFAQISGCNLASISIVGGNIFGYKEWDKLMVLLHQYHYCYNLYTDYRHLCISEVNLQEIKSLNCIVKVIVNDEFEQNILKKALLMVSDIDFELIFHISSEEQMQSAGAFCEKYQVENYTLQPVYSNFNPGFFRDFIFMDEESLMGSPISKQTIFANMTLNTIDFGKLSILANGNVYANLNFPELGNIKKDSIRDMIMIELDKGESWFRIRDKKPCSDCIYQWLCPPPSNYEIAVGKLNLCHVKK